MKQSEEYLKVVSDRDSLSEILESREKELENFSNEFDQIEQNLSAIDTSKARLLQLSQKGKSFQKTRIHNLIADIYIALDENQNTLKSLEQKLAQESKSPGFQMAVNALKKTLKAKEVEIQLLEKQLANLEIEIKNLKDAMSFKEQQLAEKDTLLANQVKKLEDQEKLIQEKENELNKVYFIRGTASELEKAGITKREGGIVGLGSVKVLSQKIGGDKIKVLNQKVDKMLLLGRYKKKKVITNHPSNSYFFIAKDGQFFIKISYPDKFWSLSKYLVVEVE